MDTSQQLPGEVAVLKRCFNLWCFCSN